MAVWVILSDISYVSGSLGHYLLPARREGGENAPRFAPSKSKTRPTGCSMDDLETDGLLRRGWRTGHRAASPAAPPRSAPPRAAPPCMRGTACA